MPTSLTPAATTVSYEFGDLALDLESGDGHWMELLERRYGRFRGSASPRRFRVRFDACGELPEDLVSPLAPRLEAFRVEPTARGFEASTETTSCEVDLAAREARLRGPSAMYPLDNLLVQLLPLLSETHVLLHAAALDLEGSGIVAAGPSGAGKSTLARLAGGSALCDELAAVRVEPSPEVIALPFWNARRGTAPLSAVLILEHGAAHRLRPLSTGEAVRRLSRLVLWPTAVAGAMERVLSRLGALVESTPVLELAFAPRGDVVHLLRKELR